MNALLLKINVSLSSFPLSSEVMVSNIRGSNMSLSAYLLFSVVF